MIQVSEPSVFGVNLSRSFGSKSKTGCHGSCCVHTTHHESHTTSTTLAAPVDRDHHEDPQLQAQSSEGHASSFDQGRVVPTVGSVRRATAQGVDSAGADSSSRRATTSAWTDFSAHGQAAHSTEEAGDCLERGFASQEQLDQVPERGTSDGHHWERDHPSSTAERFDEDLRDHRGQWRRPSGLRQTLVPVLSRAEADPAAVCRLGGEDSEGDRDRRHLRSSLPSFGLVADGAAQDDAEPQSQRHQGWQARDDHSHSHRGVGGEWLLEGDLEEGRNFQDVFRLRECHQLSDGGHESNDHAVDPSGGRLEGRDSGDQDREASQGGQEGGRAELIDGQFHGHLGAQVSCDVRAFSSSELSAANPTAPNSDVSEPHTRLNHTQSKFLDRAIEGLLPEALQSLVVSGRSRLLEVACSPDSPYYHDA